MIQQLEIMKTLQDKIKALDSVRCDAHRVTDEDADFEQQLKEIYIATDEMNWGIIRRVEAIEPWRVLDTTVFSQAPTSMEDGNYEMAKLVEAEFPQGHDDSEGGQGFFYVNHRWAQQVVDFIVEHSGTASFSEPTTDYPHKINWEELTPTGFETTPTGFKEVTA